MIRRAGAWLRHKWNLIADHHGAAESEALVASLRASAVIAGLSPGVDRPGVDVATAIEVSGVALALVAGSLVLAGFDPAGWLA